MGGKINTTAVGDPHALRVAKHLMERYNHVIAESGVRGWREVKVDPTPSGVWKKATKFIFPSGETAIGDFLVSQDGKTWKVIEAKYSSIAPYTDQQEIHYKNINRLGGIMTFEGRILKGAAPRGFTVKETVTLYSSDIDAYEKGQIGWYEMEKERINTVSKSNKEREASERRRKARTFPSTEPAISRSGVIKTKTSIASSSSEVMGSRATERGLSPRTGPPKTSKKPRVIKGEALDLKKIKESVAKTLKPRIGVAKNLARGVAKGLVVGYVVGLLESYLFNKLAGWLLKDEGVKRLNELEKRKGPEIERRMQKAVEDHVKKLPRRPGSAYKIVLEFRLVNYFTIGDIYLPHDLLIDKTLVTDYFWTYKEGCIPTKVTPDVTEVTFVGDGRSFRKGEVITLPKEKDLFQVFKCTRILDFDYPDAGKPSLEGDWRAFFIDKKGPDKVHLATYTIMSSGIEKKPKVSGINASDNRKLQIWDVEWTGHFLKFKVKHDKNTEHITMLFDEWDVLTGWSELNEGYSRVQPSMPERWERITEYEKQLVEKLKKFGSIL